MAVTYKLSDENWEMVLGLEVGFTQSWPGLVDVARQWFEKTAEVRLVLIAKLTEKPTYSNSIRNMTNKQLHQLELN